MEGVGVEAVWGFPGQNWALQPTAASPVPWPERSRISGPNSWESWEFGHELKALLLLWASFKAVTVARSPVSLVPYLL